MQEHDFLLYTDGASDQRTTAGSALILIHKEKSEILRELKINFFLGKATNNEAELLAMILGLITFQIYLNKTTNISLTPTNREESTEKTTNSNIIAVDWFTDSEYILKSTTDYIQKWQQNGWKTANRDSVKNKVLWRTYLCQKERLGDIKVRGHHVYGHTGDHYNELCDEGAVLAKNNRIDHEWNLIDLSKELDRIHQLEQKLDTITEDTFLKITEHFYNKLSKIILR